MRSSTAECSFTRAITPGLVVPFVGAYPTKKVQWYWFFGVALGPHPTLSPLALRDLLSDGTPKSEPSSTPKRTIYFNNTHTLKATPLL